MSSFYSQYQTTLPLRDNEKASHQYAVSSPTRYSGRPASINSISSGDSYSIPTSNSSPTGSEKSSTRPYRPQHSTQPYMVHNFDGTQIDHTLAQQAQQSGALHAKQLQLLELQKQARARLARNRAVVAEGMNAAKEVQRDLEWTQRKMKVLNQRAAAKYPDQYRAAARAYPKTVDGSEDDSDSSSAGSSE